MTATYQHPDEWPTKRAWTSFCTGLSRGFGEERITQAIRDMGVSCVPQYPVGRYNIDVAIPDSRLAIEVQRSWNMLDHKLKTRADYLSSHGWQLLWVDLLESSRKTSEHDIIDVDMIQKYVHFAIVALARKRVPGVHWVIGGDDRLGRRQIQRSLERVTGMRAILLSDVLYQ